MGQNNNAECIAGEVGLATVEGHRDTEGKEINMDRDCRLIHYLFLSGMSIRVRGLGLQDFTHESHQYVIVRGNW